MFTEETLRDIKKLDNNYLTMQLLHMTKEHLREVAEIHSVDDEFIEDINIFLNLLQKQFNLLENEAVGIVSNFVRDGRIE